ncbi:hypothetical protein PXC01_05960 [Maribacter sp. M208]|uniref:hypothetical protein n=2 Tax=Maribacter TaxID=252356 RepID=UPI0023ED5D5C|nr:hypothetical protein [Maribacter huludaoensis]MDF4221125.1 hypothetical protein [Maribacter huludaoensis]
MSNIVKQNLVIIFEFIIFIVFPRYFINLNHHTMISNILNGKLTSHYQKKKLVSLENYYMHLKPYFKLKKSAKTAKAESALVSKRTKSANAKDAFNSIEQNQILYAKIMTERLLNV